MFPLGTEVKDKWDCIQDLIDEIALNYNIEVEDYDSYDAEVYVYLYNVTPSKKLEEEIKKIK
jgi:hypothetical protein